jgi:hypothetical protein
LYHCRTIAGIKGLVKNAENPCTIGDGEIGQTIFEPDDCKNAIIGLVGTKVSLVEPRKIKSDQGVERQRIGIPAQRKLKTANIIEVFYKYRYFDRSVDIGKNGVDKESSRILRKGSCSWDNQNKNEDNLVTFFMRLGFNN